MTRTLNLDQIKALTYKTWEPHELEQLAQKSVNLTRKRFGHVMQLYAPLYLSNECVNTCTYCGFSQNNKIARKTLNSKEVLQEALALKETGIKHVLLVAGEHPKHVGLNYIKEITESIRPLFSSISIEIAPLTEGDYRELCDAGVSGLVVYQETYNREIYKQIHLGGPKKDFDERLQAPFYGASAGMRLLGIGCLWGLSPWQEDFIELMAHAKKIQSYAWRSNLSFSFPRLKEAEGVKDVLHPLSDRDLTLMICLTRLAFPEAQINLSTREPVSLRQSLAPLGITHMSAGSRTSPGGYSFDERQQELKQFEITDTRSVSEVKQSLETMGFDVTSKDWDRDLHGALLS